MTQKNRPLVFGNEKSFEYDGQGNLIKSNMGSINETIAYNHFGLPEQINQSKNGQATKNVNYQYNDKGWLTTKTTNSKTTSYEYNIRGSVTSIKTPSNNQRNQARIMGSIVPKYEGCWGGRTFYQDNGRLYAAGGDYTPKAGDVFFQGTKHTGLVLAYDSPWVYTIEGNADNQVKVLKRHESEFTHFGSNGGTSNGIVPPHYDKSDGRTQ